MLGGGKKVRLACGATDMRKSSDALSALVAESYKLDPYADTMFVFCNRSRDILKILEWDGDGFWLHSKKLEQGRFPWPDTVEDTATMELTQRELEFLIGSTRLRSKLKKRRIWSPGPEQNNSWENV